MSALGLGRVKTPTFNLRVEIPSRFRKFENQRCLRPPLREDDRENNSAHSWLVHVFTQPGSIATEMGCPRYVRFSAIGTFRTWRDVGFESVMSCKADVYQALPFKLIFFVLVDGWSLVAGSLVQSYGG